MLKTMREQGRRHRRREEGAGGGVRGALPHRRHQHRAVAGLHLVLQRSRRRRAGQPRLLRRRPLARSFAPRRRRRWRPTPSLGRTPRSEHRVAPGRRRAPTSSQFGACRHQAVRCLPAPGSSVPAGTRQFGVLPAPGSSGAPAAASSAPGRTGLQRPSGPSGSIQRPEGLRVTDAKLSLAAVHLHRCIRRGSCRHEPVAGCNAGEGPQMTPLAARSARRSAS